MEGPVDVSVLIPVLNEERFIRETAAQMVAQSFSGTAEFLFIDGGSTDRSREILAELAAADPRIRLLDNPGRTTPKALNVGLRAARGEYVARMDAHTHYPPQYLEVGIERIRRGDAVHVSGPAIAVGADEGSRRVALALATELGVGQADFRKEQVDEVDVDTGFAGVWRRDVLLRHGGWDEGWPSDQDCELAGRLTGEEGRMVCLPEMAADYIPRGTLRALGRQYYVYGLYKTKTLLCHPHMTRPTHLVPPVVAGTVAGAVLPGPVGRLARVGLGAYVAALVTASVRARRLAPPSDVAWLPAIYMTMHVTYGFGFLAGLRRWGVPVAGLRVALRRLAGS